MLFPYRKIILKKKIKLKSAIDNVLIHLGEPSNINVFESYGEKGIRYAETKLKKLVSLNFNEILYIYS